MALALSVPDSRPLKGDAPSVTACRVGAPLVWGTKACQTHRMHSLLSWEHTGKQCRQHRLKCTSRLAWPTERAYQTHGRLLHAHAALRLTGLDENESAPWLEHPLNLLHIHEHANPSRG